MKNNKRKRAIAFGFNAAGAELAKKHLINNGFAENDIRITSSPQIILNLAQGEADVVVFQTHPTDMNVWKKQMPMCKHLKNEAHIKHVILKMNA